MAIGTRASPFSETPRPLRLPDSRAAPSIFHCLEGSSVVAITSRDRPCSCYFSIPRCGFSRRRAFVSSETLERRRFFENDDFDDFVALRARAHALRRFPSVPLLSQLKKQNDKESARDMTGYKPSNFDKGFRDGKGWGDLVRRASSPRFPPFARRSAFDEASRSFRRGRALSPAAWQPTRLAADRCEDQSTPLDLHVRIIPRRAATTARRGR